MRFETTFLPLRTSTTSSMGISTRPILSCRLNAATRLSRLSLTFFSKPEYVWMMYHCIAIAAWFPSDAKDFEDVSHPSLHQPIHNRQKQPEEKYRGNYHCGCGHHVVLARPSDLLHLHAHVMQKLARVRDRAANALADSCRGPGDCVTARFLVLHFYRLRGHKTSALPETAEPFRRSHSRALPGRQSLAGEEGFEPPYPVLETGVLAVGRLP